MRSLMIGVSCLGVLGSLLFAIDEAKACQPDTCEYTNQFLAFEPSSTIVASDGLLSFVWSRGTWPSLSVEQALEQVTLELHDAEGMIVEGALEYREWANAVVWQPSSPVEPGDFTLHLFVDNSALHEFDDHASWTCNDDIEKSIPISVVGPLPPMPEVETTVEVGHTFVTVRELENMVCCDDAMPMLVNMCDYEEILWDVGHCESTVHTGRMTASWNLSWASGPEVATTFAPRFVRNDTVYFGTPGATSFAVRQDEILCGRFELVSLAGGEVVASSEGCFGDELAEMLGRLDRDPSEDLAACTNEPYVCSVVSDDDGWMVARWDSEDCEPWGDEANGEDGGEGGGDAGDAGDGDQDGDHDGDQDGGIADRGCGCASAPGLTSMAWLLPVLGFVRRRRR